MDESRATAFGDHAGSNPDDRGGKRKVRLRRFHGALRVAATISFGLAISSACVVLALDCIRYFGPAFPPWRLKSAFPLIFAGISYGCLQLALPRSWKELALGLAVCAAFILWGIEQFVPDSSLKLLMDDVVVFLFVMDLSIVIRGYLKIKRGGGR